MIDTQVRIRAQRRSLARVEALFDRAQSISDIIRIESQVSRRQADLESLERRLSYLNDQTSMSTISVNISLPPEEKKEKKEEKKEPEEAGFFAGLSDGWNAFKDFAPTSRRSPARCSPSPRLLAPDRRPAPAPGPPPPAPGRRLTCRHRRRRRGRVTYGLLMISSAEA